MKIKLLVGLLTAAVASLALAQTAPLSHPLPSPSGQKPVATAAAPKEAFREITWDELVPKDWDPTKAFKDVNMAAMADSDPRAIAALKRMRKTWTTRQPTTQWTTRWCASPATSCRSKTARPA